ncbi:LRRNT 2 domain-containing protein [Citrus sinensis]|uniref:Leucine-rich repeat-containing N-terminal plant-type domain-containing protein n=1 Tax=Citrus clementina TaxID=85681 RepID=V4UZ36_CITCL|nr:hypothetical protein CICLE_v10003361mg [Citrus x clementina]KAH9684532.1 LRRNT 2 domain-containing protein [Citrus sinensis]
MKIDMSLLYFAPIMLVLPYFIVSSLALPTSSVKNITTDQHALLAFKEQVIDPRGVLAHNWSVSHPVCSWVGISCDSRHHRVTKLDLSDSSLEGPISAHLGNISFLVSLNISGNNFHGHLPNELRQLRRLKFIDFNFNRLSGVLPSWMGSLPKLRMLSLRYNSFRGDLLLCYISSTIKICEEICIYVDLKTL